MSERKATPRHKPGKHRAGGKPHAPIDGRHRATKQRRSVLNPPALAAGLGVVGATVVLTLDSADPTVAVADATLRNDVVADYVVSDTRESTQTLSRERQRNPSRAGSRQAVVVEEPVTRLARTPEPARPALPPWIADCLASTSARGAGLSNGLIDSDDLCHSPDDVEVRSEAAIGWWRLTAAYSRQFGTSICVTDSYRSLQEQYSLYSQKPGLAARPGTSNHGWGTAVDLCGGIESFGSSAHVWMQQNAPRWGWINPSWAQVGGSKPEPWHWEYVGDE